MVPPKHQDNARDWVRRWTLALFISAVALFLASGTAHGQTYASITEARAKLSTDLQQSLTATSVSGTSWARETASGRLVKVLVIASPQVDPDLVYLRRAITDAGGSVYYQTIGTAPNRRFVILWDTTVYLAATVRLDFRVVLNETTNNIDVCYVNTNAGSVTYNAGLSSTAGIQNGLGAALQYSCNTATLVNGLLLTYMAQ